jgi:hypothetical protein
MTESRILKLGNRDETKRVRWLQKATDKDRTMLSGIHVKNGSSVATDGYKMFASTTPAGFESAEPVTLRIDCLPATSTIAEVSTIDEPFVGYADILPKSEPVFEIHMDAELLKSALEACAGRDLIDRIVRLAFHGDSSPMEVFGRMSDQPVYALIMPTSKERSPDRTWRPE